MLAVTEIWTWKDKKAKLKHVLANKTTKDKTSQLHATENNLHMNAGNKVGPAWGSIVNSNDTNIKECS